MFKNSTKVTYKLNYEINTFKFAMMAIIISVIFVILVGWVWISVQFKMIDLIYCVLMLIFIQVYFLLLLEFKIKREMRKYPLRDKNNIRSFCFEENEFSVVSERLGVVNLNAVYKYEDIPKAIEHKENFYLFLGSTQVYALTKSGMTEGSFENLKEFLKTKFKNRYHIRKGIFQKKLK